MIQFNVMKLNYDPKKKVLLYISQTHVLKNIHV